MAEETKAKESQKFDFTKLNNLAVVSLATAVTGFGAVAGIITGHIALAQLKKSKEAGRPAALAGVVIGYVFVGAFIVMSIAGAFLRNRGYDFGGMRQDDHGMMGGFQVHIGNGPDDSNGAGGMMQWGPSQVPPSPAPTATTN